MLSYLQEILSNMYHNGLFDVFTEDKRYFPFIFPFVIGFSCYVVYSLLKIILRQVNK